MRNFRHALDTDDLCFLENNNVDDVVTPMNAEDGAKRTLMKTLKQS